MHLPKALRTPLFPVILLAVTFASAQESKQPAQDQPAEKQAPAEQAQPAQNPESGSVKVVQATIARDVQDRAPVGEATTFPPDVQQVACFTKIEGATAGAQIFHVWMHGDEQVARVPLNIGGPSWRTWSTKRILPQWTGPWSVRIEDASGNVLQKLDFTIGEAQ